MIYLSKNIFKSPKVFRKTVVNVVIRLPQTWVIKLVCEYIIYIQNTMKSRIVVEYIVYIIWVICVIMCIYVSLIHKI